MKRLAIVITHPIQYYAPVFTLLQKRGHLNLRVFYTLGDAGANLYDPGFKKSISWDIPLLDGYAYEWVTNTSTEPGSHHGKGIINPDLNKRIAAYHPDAILIFGWAYHGHFKAMRYFKGKIPVWFRGDSTLLDQAVPFKEAARWLWLRWVYSFVDHAFYVGKNNKKYFERYGLNQDQLSFAPHAIDNDRFAMDRSAEVKALRTRLNIADEQTLILFTGKFEDKKAPGLLVEAIDRLALQQVYLLLTGSGKLEYRLKQQAANSKYIRFIDFQNQSYMPVIYQACDLFCLPSSGPGETWGLAVNEAMAAGKPVLVSDKVGCAADLVSADNGATFPARNLEALSRQIKKLVSNQQNLKLLGERSSAIIARWNFTELAMRIEEQLLNNENIIYEK
jgi:glycosyltransferase involved in cell wall biosynthesis